jgi:hypothetical protein
MLASEVERAVTRSSMALFFLFALACNNPTSRPEPRGTPTEPTGVPAMPVPVIETTEVLAPPAPSLDDVDLEGDDLDVEDEAEAPSGAREIHPHGGMTDCLEMYSACSPDPASPGAQRCTSAPLLLSCGQSGTIPGGETLVCVCP